VSTYAVHHARVSYIFVFSVPQCCLHKQQLLYHILLYSSVTVTAPLATYNLAAAGR